MIKFRVKNLIKKLYKTFSTNNNFFKKLGSENEYLKIFVDTKDKNYPNINEYEVASNFKIDKEWLDNLALHTQVVKKNSKINYQHGRILYLTLRKYLAKTSVGEINIFESGTARGFSSICMSKALIDSNQKGTIHTTDILPHLKQMYWNTVDDHTRGKLSRLELLEKWSKELENIKFYTMKSSEFFKSNDLKRINFAFLDAVHDSENIKLEFEYVKNRQLKGDVIIFDDFDDQYITLKDYILKEVHISYNYEILESEKNRHYFIAHKK